MAAHILIFIHYFVFAWFQQICIKWPRYEVIWLGIHQRHSQMSNNMMEQRIINHWLKCKAEWNQHEMKAPVKVHRYRDEDQIISDWGSVWLDLGSREWSWWAMKEGISGHLGPKEHHWLRVQLLEVRGSPRLCLQRWEIRWEEGKLERHLRSDYTWHSESRSVTSDSFWPQGLHTPWNSPGQNTGVGSHFFSRGSSQPRDRTQVSHTAGRFFTNWAIREIQIIYNLCLNFLLKYSRFTVLVNFCLTAKWFLVPQLCPTLCSPMDCSPPGSSVHGDSPGKNTGVGCHALLQGIFLT